MDPVFKAAINTAIEWYIDDLERLIELGSPLEQQENAAILAELTEAKREFNKGE